MQENIIKKQLCELLGKEPIPTSEKFQKYCRDNISKAVAVMINKNTGEEQKFPSIYKAAKTFGINAGLSSYRLNRCRNHCFIKIGKDI